MEIENVCSGEKDSRSQDTGKLKSHWVRIILLLNVKDFATNKQMKSELQYNTTDMPLASKIYFWHKLLLDHTDAHCVTQGDLIIQVLADNSK